MQTTKEKNTILLTSNEAWGDMWFSKHNKEIIFAAVKFKTQKTLVLFPKIGIFADKKK